MRVLVLNGSPAGEDSITLFTVKYLEKRFPDVGFETLHVGQRIRSFEKDFAPAKEKLQGADLLLFAYPVYTFLVPAQLHRFVELMKESGIDFAGKYATQITTSKHFYDVTAHRFMEDNFDDMGLRHVRGLSADMEDLLTEKGRREAESFFRFVLWEMERGYAQPPRHGAPEPFLPVVPKTAAAAPKKPGAVVIVTDREEGADDALGAMIDRFSAKLPYETRVVNLRTFPFAGGCLGCFHCAADGTCVYKDGFDTYLRENIQSADAIVYAYTIRDHSMGYRFKLYDDRQFCNGHRTVTMGKPVPSPAHGGPLPGGRQLSCRDRFRRNRAGAGDRPACRDPGLRCGERVSAAQKLLRRRWAQDLPGPDLSDAGPHAGRSQVL